MRAGQAFTIVLASNPSTGYSWALAAAPPAAIVTLLGNSYQQDAAPPTLPMGDSPVSKREITARRCANEGP